MTQMLLEIVCSTVDDAVEAELGGADRVELCSASGLGGLTPSLGTLVEVKRRVKVPVMAMVRPREGGFCYSEAEFETMLRDCEYLVERGADGIVFGCLAEDGRIDEARARRLMKLIGERQAVFHRAFDVAGDRMESLEQLIGMGCKRV